MSSQRTHFQKGVCIRACARKSTAVATAETVGPTGVGFRSLATVQKAWKRSRGPNAVQNWVLATPCKHKKMICKLLIPAPWHGRGQRFEPVQVHQPHLLHTTLLVRTCGCDPFHDYSPQGPKKVQTRSKVCFQRVDSWYGSDRVSSPPNLIDYRTSWYAWCGW